MHVIRDTSPAVSTSPVAIVMVACPFSLVGDVIANSCGRIGGAGRGGTAAITGDSGRVANGRTAVAMLSPPVTVPVLLLPIIAIARLLSPTTVAVLPSPSAAALPSPVAGAVLPLPPQLV